MAHLTREEVVASGVVSEEFRKAFTARPLNIAASTFHETRAQRAAHLQRLRHLYPIPGPIPDEVVETMYDVPMRDGETIQVRVYQPAKGEPEGGSPLVMMYHEGGWCMGDLTDEDLNCRMFARELGAVCVNVGYRYVFFFFSTFHPPLFQTYIHLKIHKATNSIFEPTKQKRLAPEHKFPTGIHDSWDALTWALANSTTLLRATPTRGLIVGGSSAGGNIAAVLALLARDTNLSPPITGQYLSVPVLLPSTNVPAHLSHLYTSRRDNVFDPVLHPFDDADDGPASLAGIYAPVRESPLWDPFNHHDGHKGVARAFFQVCGMDPLRDEAVLYDARLREAGVLTRFELYHGVGHMFWTNWPEFERSREFVRDTLKGVRWLLEA
ncbi:alpha/beta-hydrolase [Periconia macrospinosa]|uniref:Alpha/beta-hydrolase n=1 Tax=Periconia macrospinosa TaxID=97972 RepID=A0A2V1DF47_9PLEO|nr:alpha/beta-hydrolase [Periconia macrospinosa]